MLLYCCVFCCVALRRDVTHHRASGIITSIPCVDGQADIYKTAVSGVGMQPGADIAGGLDFIYLCYDTCAHTPGGRRNEEGTMPWHDCHCAVTGPAAWDVLEGALPCSHSAALSYCQSEAGYAPLCCCTHAALWPECAELSCLMLSCCCSHAFACSGVAGGKPDISVIANVPCCMLAYLPLLLSSPSRGIIPPGTGGHHLTLLFRWR